MKLIAKDFSNKTSLLDAVMDICGKFIEIPKITIVGMADVKCPSSIKQLKFKMLPKNTVLDIPEIPAQQIEQAFCWQHTEARISNEDDEQGMPWISENSLSQIIDTWTKLDFLISANGTDLDDYYHKCTTEKKSSYTMSREDLMFLLNLKGTTSLRQMILSKNQSPYDFSQVIFHSLHHNLITRSPFNTDTNYPVTIKAMGERINLLISNFKSLETGLATNLSSQIVHDLKLLSAKYPETDCIGVSGDQIDVSETTSSLMLTKDPQYVFDVGSAILKPLNLLFASLASGSVWTLGFEQANSILLKTDTEILEKFKNSQVGKIPSFIGAEHA